MLDILHTINYLPLAELEVGQHFYWELGSLKIHGQILLTSWFVIALIVLAALTATLNVQRIPSGMQNFMEYIHTITVTNQSTAAIRNVVVTDTIPTGFSLDASSAGTWSGGAGATGNVTTTIAGP
ncbi:MAG: DUF11 domain-containing protein, partial [Okeania sp. SIO2D1]|nr:DUF11 domain-containing protein [Okeania sp. SIO2D1]